jgi:type II secretory pathway pseudopilin PulG
MKRFYKSVLGVTLLEIMLVLAIAAMIIVMSVRYYQSASSSQQANALLEQIQAITAAADGLAQASGSYSVAAISNSNLKALMPGGEHAFLTPWGTTITVGTPTGSTYNVKIEKAPAGVCPLVISKLVTNNHYKSLAPAAASSCGSSAIDISYDYTANP